MKPYLKYLIPFGFAVCAIGAWAWWWSECQHGDLSRSIHACTRIVNLGILESRKNRGYAYCNRANAYDKAIGLKPDYALAYTNRGFAYANKGEVDRAIADYRKALQIDPTYVTPKKHLKDLDVRL